MTERITIAIAAAAATALLASGCGVGGQDHATVIPSGDLPSLDTSTVSPSNTPSPTESTTGASPSPADSPTATVFGPSSTVYLISDNALVGEFRPRTQTATLTDLVRTLLRGPTDAEASRGISTAINTSPTLNNAIIVNSIATLDLSATFGDIRPPDQVLATAQVVMTAVSFPGVDAVQISLDGKPIQVPLADGTLSTAPLTYSDYSGLLAGAGSPRP